MTEYFGRSAWTSTARPDRLAAMDPGQVRGIAVHHTGCTTSLGARSTLQRSARWLEQERAVAASRRGRDDIACQAAIDVEGRVFECRGIDVRSEANGNATANQQYGAVQWLIGAGDGPTPALVEAFRDWRRTRWLTRYPKATAVVGHRDLYPTDCPGGSAHALIRSGLLTDDGGSVALSEAEIDAIATRTRDRILAVAYGNQPDGRPFTLGMLWGEVRVNAMRAATGVDLEAVAAAVIARLPDGGAGADPHTLAVAVADELAQRLKR